MGASSHARGSTTCSAWEACQGDGALAEQPGGYLSDEGILRYQRAIRFYSDKLDQTW
jgi:hypothetical protein